MSSSAATKKPRGRPATGIGKQVQVRLQPAELDALDAYRGEQTRPAAIRAILKEKLDV
jgi:hypothetical protein